MQEYLSPSFPEFYDREELEQKATLFALNSSYQIVLYLVRGYREKTIDWLLQSRLDKTAVDEIFGDLFGVFALETWTSEDQEKGLSYLYDMHSERALRYIRKRGIPPKNKPLCVDGDIDMLDKAFLILKTKSADGTIRHDYLTKGKPCMAFLYGVLKNLVTKYWSEHDKDKTNFFQEDGETEVSVPPDFLELVETDIDFGLILDQLERNENFPIYCSPLFKALYYGNMSIKEYAKVMNEQRKDLGTPALDEDAYRQQKSRCQKKARDILKGGT